MFYKSKDGNYVVQNLNGETLVYELHRQKAYCLNETSAFIWNNLDGKQSVSQIAEALAKKTKQPVNEEIVWLAINELKKEELMEEFEAPNSPLKNMSRREAIKRVGLATMIALPIVSSLTAPQATHAASNSLGGCGSPCDANCRTGGCNTADGNYCFDESFRSIPSGQTYCTNQNIDCSDAASKCCSGGPATVVDYDSCPVPRSTRCRCS
jgi:hypothetical protein